MKRYTIDQLSHLSGLPDTTILFWHKKYNVFPDIIPTKDRTFKYNTNHLYRLLNIATLFHLDKKYSLEKICLLESNQLEIKVEIELLANLIKNKLNEDIINQLLAATLTYNGIKFNLIIDSALKKLTTQDFYKFVMYPFLVRIFETFHFIKEFPVQFYYMMNLLERKLHHLIHNTASVYDKNKTILLYLPENELYEIGLLFANLLLKERGYRTFYIGANQNVKSIKQFIEDVNPDIILSFDTNSANYKSYLKIFEAFPEEIDKFYLIGRQITIEKYKIPRKQKFYNIDEFNIFFEELELKKAN